MVHEQRPPMIERTLVMLGKTIAMAVAPTMKALVIPIFAFLENSVFLQQNMKH